MDSVSLLLRTAIRTFYPTPRHILILDALLLHKVLHLEDLNVLLSAQSKEVRIFLNPLRASRFVSTHTRKEVRVTAAAAGAGAGAGGAGASQGSGSSFGYGDRTVQRDYYFINILEAIDAIKYRIAKLRKQIESAYKADAEAEAQGTNKDWYCPRCKSEYDMMTVLGFEQGPDGFVCEKCGQGLVQDEERIKERGTGREGGGGHRKMKRLNEQLARLDELIGSVDRDVESGKVKVQEVIGPDGKGDGGFERAWEERVRVRRADDVTGTGATTGDRFVDVKKKEKGPDAVKAENLEVRIRTEGELGEEEKRREEERRERVRKQNEMPEWHKGSAIGRDPVVVKAEESNGVKAEADEEQEQEQEEEKKKVDTKQAEMDEQMQQYLALIEEERAHEERKKKQAEQDEQDEEDEEGDDEDDEDGFEDALGTSVAGTPMSSFNTPDTRPSNGVKRDFEEDSSEAATPMSMPDTKRVKVETSTTSAVPAPALAASPAPAPAPAATAAATTTAAAAPIDAPDSDEGEDFEDV